MVSSAVLDAIADPSRVLLDLFNDGGPLDSFPQKVSSYFSHLFSSSPLYHELPILDPSHPPHSHNHRSIVRFRAMVQDTSLSHEIYLAKRNDGSCGGWGLNDFNEISFDDIDYGNLRDRHVIWAVSIPGESQWSLDVMCGQNDRLPSAPSVIDQARAHKYPLPETSHVGTQLKIYDLSSETYKSTDIVEFVGILSLEPCSTDVECTTPTFVPTLHVLFSTALPIALIQPEYTVIDEARASDLRDELITWIADEALAGDKGAAEWILLCSIARVQAKHHPILPPPVTLSHFPPSSLTPTISHVLALIFPILITIPLSLQVLNQTNFYPQSKDEDLHSGWLQLPRGTTCVIAEGGVKEGEINGKGLLNIRAMQDALDSQTLQYMFPYSRFTFDTDLNFILLSDGRKSAFFQTYLNVPLRPAINNTTADELKDKLYKPRDMISLPPVEKLEQFRRLACGAKIWSSGIEQTIAQYIQDDFVKERTLTAESNAERIGSDELMFRIQLARLYAASLHQSTVSILIWESVKVMEAERKSRSVHC